MFISNSEAQEIVDALEDAMKYVPTELEPHLDKAIEYFVARFDVISDDAELVYAEKE